MRSRKSFLDRKASLDTAYFEYKPYYIELADFVATQRGRFLSKNNSRKITRNTKVINNKARISLRTMQGGLMAGITSPARPWFNLQTTDPSLMDLRSVKLYLSEVESLMREVFSQSNIYNSLHSLYGELGTFGICPMGIFKDYDNVIHCHTYTVGSYRVASNEKGLIDTFYREYTYTVDQMIKKWGLKRCSTEVQKLFHDGSTEKIRNILHVIEVNDGRDHMSPASWNMPYRSVHIELDVSEIEDIKIKSGFESFPIVTPRWDVIGEETYSNSCPGMDAIGDIKALQLGEKRSAQAIDYQIKPVLQAPPTFSRYEGSGGLLPGDIIIGSDPTGKGMRSVHDSNAYRLDWHEAKLGQIEDRISKAFYEDLFLMISNDRRSNITATEIVERHEEKLLMLGPVLERLHNELLDPTIDRTYSIMDEVGILPEPPRELENAALSINYISVLAQAQRLAQLNDINSFTGFVGSVSELYPEARHKININKTIDIVGDAYSVDPDMIVPTDEAAAAAQAEQQAKVMSNMAEQAPGVADALKTVSETDPSADMLQRLVGTARQ